jgi:hypothetical protein
MRRQPLKPAPAKSVRMPRCAWPRRSASTSYLAYGLEVRRISYAPPKNQTKRWSEEAQMEGWFPRSRGEHTC